MIFLLIFGVILLVIAVILLFVVWSGFRREESTPTSRRPTSNEVVFFNRLVNVMIGGKSFGTMMQLSLPGDEPEVWQIDLSAPNVSSSDRHITRQHIGPRSEIEEWVREQVQLLAANYEMQFVHESSSVGA